MNVGYVNGASSEEHLAEQNMPTSGGGSSMGSQWDENLLDPEEVKSIFTSSLRNSGFQMNATNGTSAYDNRLPQNGLVSLEEEVDSLDIIHLSIKDEELEEMEKMQRAANASTGVSAHDGSTGAIEATKGNASCGSSSDGQFICAAASRALPVREPTSGAAADGDTLAAEGDSEVSVVDSGRCNYDMLDDITSVIASSLADPDVVTDGYGDHQRSLHPLTNQSSVTSSKSSSSNTPKHFDNQYNAVPSLDRSDQTRYSSPSAAGIEECHSSKSPFSPPSQARDSDQIKLSSGHSLSSVTVGVVSSIPADADAEKSISGQHREHLVECFAGLNGKNGHVKMPEVVCVNLEEPLNAADPTENAQQSALAGLMVESPSGVKLELDGVGCEMCPLEFDANNDEETLDSDENCVSGELIPHGRGSIRGRPKTKPPPRYKVPCPILPKLDPSTVSSSSIPVILREEDTNFSLEVYPAARPRSSTSTVSSGIPSVVTEALSPSSDSGQARPDSIKNPSSMECVESDGPMTFSTAFIPHGHGQYLPSEFVGHDARLSQAQRYQVVPQVGHAHALQSVHLPPGSVTSRIVEMPPQRQQREVFVQREEPQRRYVTINRQPSPYASTMIPPGYGGGGGVGGVGNLQRSQNKDLGGSVGHHVLTTVQQQHSPPSYTTYLTAPEGSGLVLARREELEQARIPFISNIVVPIGSVPTSRHHHHSTGPYVEPPVSKINAGYHHHQHQHQQQQHPSSSSSSFGLQLMETPHQYNRNSDLPPKPKDPPPYPGNSSQINNSQPAAAYRINSHLPPAVGVQVQQHRPDPPAAGQPGSKNMYRHHHPHPIIQTGPLGCAGATTAIPPFAPEQLPHPLPSSTSQDAGLRWQTSGAPPSNHPPSYKDGDAKQRMIESWVQSSAGQIHPPYDLETKHINSASSGTVPLDTLPISSVLMGSEMSVSKPGGSHSKKNSRSQRVVATNKVRSISTVKKVDTITSHQQYVGQLPGLPVDPLFYGHQAGTTVNTTRSVPQVDEFAKADEEIDKLVYEKMKKKDDQRNFDCPLQKFVEFDEPLTDDILCSPAATDRSNSRSRAIAAVINSQASRHGGDVTLTQHLIHPNHYLDAAKDKNSMDIYLTNGNNGSNDLLLRPPRPCLIDQNNSSTQGISQMSNSSMQFDKSMNSIPDGPIPAQLPQETTKINVRAWAEQQSSCVVLPHSADRHAQNEHNFDLANPSGKDFPEIDMLLSLTDDQDMKSSSLEQQFPPGNHAQTQRHFTPPSVCHSEDSRAAVCNNHQQQIMNISVTAAASHTQQQQIASFSTASTKSTAAAVSNGIPRYYTPSSDHASSGGDDAFLFRKPVNPSSAKTKDPYVATANSNGQHSIYGTTTTTTGGGSSQPLMSTCVSQLSSNSQPMSSVRGDSDVSMTSDRSMQSRQGRSMNSVPAASGGRTQTHKHSDFGIPYIPADFNCGVTPAAGKNSGRSNNHQDTIRVEEWLNSHTYLNPAKSNPTAHPASNSGDQQQQQILLANWQKQQQQQLQQQQQIMKTIPAPMLPAYSHLHSNGQLQPLHAIDDGDNELEIATEFSFCDFIPRGGNVDHQSPASVSTQLPKSKSSSSGATPSDRVIVTATSTNPIQLDATATRTNTNKLNATAKSTNTNQLNATAKSTNPNQLNATAKSTNPNKLHKSRSSTSSPVSTANQQQQPQPSIQKVGTIVSPPTKPSRQKSITVSSSIQPAISPNPIVRGKVSQAHHRSESPRSRRLPVSTSSDQATSSAAPSCNSNDLKKTKEYSIVPSSRTLPIAISGQVTSCHSNGLRAKELSVASPPLRDDRTNEVIVVGERMKNSVNITQSSLTNQQHRSDDHNCDDDDDEEEEDDEVSFTGSDVFRPDDQGETILHCLCDIPADRLEDFSDAPGFKEALNSSNNAQETPLFVGVHNKRADVVTFLTRNGADSTISCRSPANAFRAEPVLQSVIHEASELGDIKTLNILLKSDDASNIDLQRPSSGLTPLMVALHVHSFAHRDPSADRTKVVKFLLTKGASLTVRDTIQGKTPFLYAVESRDVAMVKKVFFNLMDADEARIAVTMRTNRGLTCLHFAAGLSRFDHSQKVELIRTLILAGADPSVRNAEGASPRDWARREIEEVFQNLPRPT